MGAGECKRAGVEDAVGRPVAPWRLSGGLGDYRVGASEIVAHLPGRQAQEAAVPMAVERDMRLAPRPGAAGWSMWLVVS